jgi:hypothetical protein
MDLPRFSTKQYWGRAAWIGSGLVAICLGLPPYHDKIEPGGGGMAHYPDPRRVLLVFGCIAVVSGITALASRRRPLILVGLTLLAMIVFPFACFEFWETLHPETAYRKGRTEEDMRPAVNAGNVGLVIGTVAVPLIAAVAAAIRKPSGKKEPPPSA